MIAASLSLALALFGTPVAIRILRAKGIGQRIREDGPKAHIAKKGTPTMGGLVIIGAAVVAYAAAHIPHHRSAPFTASGLLALFIVVGLGALGFIDGYIKVRKRRYLGPAKRWKFVAASVCYMTPHSLDLSIVAASLLGAAAGFLWWNAAPARIFMGDTGSLALGGAMGALALLTNTDLLIIVIGGLYVIEVSSVILQVVSFRVFGKRALLMAPLHHHFELLDWPEFTVIVRFWILAGLFVAFGLGLFYADFIARGGVG